MELLSNLLWLVTCLIAWGIWFYGSRRLQGQPDRTRALRALALLILLLFPVISVSDDLQMRISAVEASNSEPLFDDNIVTAIALLSWLLLFLVLARLGFISESSREEVAEPLLFSNVTKRPPPMFCRA